MVLLPFMGGNRVAIEDHGMRHRDSLRCTTVYDMCLLVRGRSARSSLPVANLAAGSAGRLGRYGGLGGIRLGSRVCAAPQRCRRWSCLAAYADKIGEHDASIGASVLTSVTAVAATLTTSLSWSRARDIGFLADA